MSALAELAEELVSLEPAAHFRRWSVEDFCGEHEKQLAFVSDQAGRKHVICARQSGKSWGDDAIMLERALRTPNSLHVLLGLNGVAVRMNNWVPVWLPLLERYGVQHKPNQQMMLSTFPNGARVGFAGTDDLKHVKNWLGNRLSGGTFIIDEAQDQADTVLQYILKVMLPPALTPSSQVILSGVRPDVPAGKFYEMRTDGGKPDGWARHSWARWDNVHTPEARAELAAHMAYNHLTEDDPQIQRDWFNQDVYDPNARDYFYREDVNAYDPVTPEWARTFTAPPGFGDVRFAEPWPGVDTFSVAIDPGGSDPFGLQVIGWGKTHRRIQHLVDWTSPRGARLTWGDVMGTLGSLVAKRYPTIHWCYDTNSDTELDTFGHQYGVPVIRAAKKADFLGQIRRTNDLLKPGTLAVMRGSSLATDYLSAQLDRSGPAKWKSNYHPTASECVRYGLGAYWLMHVEPKAVPKLDPFDKEAKRMAEQLKRARR